MNTPSMPAQIRASVFLGPGKSLEPRSFRPRELATGEVLVEVTWCSLCGSDLHTYLGHRCEPTPVVLGHEVIGRIAAFGPGRPPRDWHGQELTIGDRVSWSVVASCGECFFCLHDLPQKCDHLFKYGHESITNAFPLSGGLAEFCYLVRGTAVFRVPDEVSDMVAASANCATATVAAAYRAAGGCRAKSVLIQGAGMLGLTAAAMASAEGAELVIVTDVDSNRLATAKRFGASNVVHAAEHPQRLIECVRDSTEGRGIDLALEMSGAPEAVMQGLSVLRTGGCYILAGAVRPIGPVPLLVEQVVRRMWNIRGVHNYAPVDLATAIDFLATHGRRFPFEELVSAVFPLAQADTAFREMQRMGAVRVAVCPSLA